jgi:hypothetical protein
MYMPNLSQFDLLDVKKSFEVFDVVCKMIQNTSCLKCMFNLQFMLILFHNDIFSEEGGD